MKQRQIGGITMARVLESNSPDFDPLGFFQQTTEDDWAPHKEWLQPNAMDPVSGNLIFPMQSYVLRTAHHTILVDACVGNHKQRPDRPHWHETTGTQYMEGLAALDLTPEDIDYVMCTHMHVDHVGWNTKLVDGRWVPTFPNAKYVFSQKEFDHWDDLNKKTPLPHLIDSVLPIVEAGRSMMVKNDFALDDEVWLTPTPGHTPDHLSVRLASEGAEAVLSGDLMHCPVQCRHPEWVARPDFNPEQAIQTRRDFMETYCETDILVCTAHFPLPSAGRFVRLGDGFDFEYDTQDW